MNKNKYTLLLIAPNGDFFTKGTFNSIKEAKNYWNDLERGNDWYYYPYRAVIIKPIPTTDLTLSEIDLNKVISKILNSKIVVAPTNYPDNLSLLKGKKVLTYIKLIKTRYR